MTTTKATRIHAYGGNDIIKHEQVALPAPKAGEILVRVQAAGVNPIDWKIRAGYLQKMMPLPLPLTLGGDFAGVVEAIGPGVTGFKPGDEVFGQAPVMMGGSGAFAEHVLAQAGTTAKKPARASTHEAAALPLVGASAVQAIIDTLRVAKGQKVLIHGGAGGIGSIAIQIAKHLGAYVATTAAPSEAAFVKGLGADRVIDYTTAKFEQELKDFDAVLDTVGGDTYARSFKVLKRGGRIVSMLEQPRQDLMQQYGVEASMQFTQPAAERLARAAKLFDDGAIKINIDRVFPLDSAAAALHSVETTPPKGKVILKVA